MIPTTFARPDVRRWRASLLAMFLMIGIAFASWVARTPDIRDAISASTAEMGLVLGGLSVGSIIGVTSTGVLVARFGTRMVLATSGAVAVSGLLTLTLGTALGSAIFVAAGLALFGLGLGAAEVAINIDGTAVEHASGRPVLPMIHGCFSVGAAVGALAGMAFSAAALPVTVHMGVIALLMAATIAWVTRGVPAVRRSEPAAGGSAAPVWRDRRVLLIGVVVLGMAFAEGTANDWLPLIVVDGFGASTTLGSLTFALFALAMAAGRFGAPWLLDRLGRSTALRATALIAAVGVLVVILAPSLGIAALGVIAWGLGASLGFPVALSAAGDDPEQAAARVSAVATVGYLAFLAGPPLLGLLGETMGLRNAIGAVLVALLAAVLAASAARPRDADDRAVVAACAGR